MLSDETLVAKAQQGDREAMGELLDRHADLIYRLALRITGNPADADDAAQEAMINCVRRIGSFDGRSKFSTWVYRVATNSALDETRRRKRRATPSDFIADGEAYGASSGPGERLRRPSAPGLSDRVLSPADVAAANDNIEYILDGLSPEHRAILILREVCDMSYDEVADTLGIAPGTVRSRLARARRSAAQKLMELDPPHLSSKGTSDDPQVAP
ncbi:MAG: sigma-70 family RNA polymerase sigma factor [Acidimicrobiia bacterium]|nr:sigma-70 family RNA polymerase sigma factor [Acidimicrobiia bacterium]MBP8179407.1 sigma-70 family RNA polymerase sigma factor [Acidimicrobiia bacterium]